MTTRSHYKSSPPGDVSKLKVAVLAGGSSREREVSIQSGKCVADALKKAEVSVVVSDIKPDSLEILSDESIDVFFIALHGTFGEDGALQEILESKGLIFTGSRSKASKLAFDKWQSKKLFTKAGIPTPQAFLFEPDAKNADLENRIGRLGNKYVIKPLREGSTIGISIADNPAQAIADAKKCAAEFGDCFIEKFITGREFTVSVLGNIALPILEVRPKAGIYDYHAKYIDDGTQYLFDTIAHPALVAKIKKYAVDCFNVLGCRGAARVDFILDDSGTPYALEINTIPGMTKHSLLPKAAEKAGMSMSRLCLKMLEMAIADSPARHIANKVNSVTGRSR
ncbi:MAG: D-alanine--D-alanine ligase [Sedimentisphaerales bacterium]